MISHPLFDCNNIECYENCVEFVAVEKKRNEQYSKQSKKWVKFTSREKSFFHNCYPCEIEKNGIKFHSVSQAYSYFNADNDSAKQKIMKRGVCDFKKHRSCGMSGYKSYVECGIGLLYELLQKKFASDVNLAMQLLRTGRSAIAFVSNRPYTTKVGWRAYYDSSKMKFVPGVLGVLLMKVRGDLIKKFGLYEDGKELTLDEQMFYNHNKQDVKTSDDI